MTTLDHDGLLTLARKAHAAACDVDVERLTDGLGAFAHALAEHLGYETPMLTRLPPAEARLIRRGQARVSAAAEALLHEAEGGCASPSHRCAARAEELLALLTLQARDERLALHNPASAAPARRWGR